MFAYIDGSKPLYVPLFLDVWGSRNHYIFYLSCSTLNLSM